MSFHPLKGQDVHEKGLAEARDQDMEKPPAVGIRGRNPAPEEGYDRVSRGVRCPYIGACQNAGLRTLLEKNTVLSMWVI